MRIRFFIFIFFFCSILNYAQLSTTQEIKAISEKLQKIVPYLKARTVVVEVKMGARRGFGSGAIISSDGLILTCAHVSEISDDLTIIMLDGTRYHAKKLGMNSSNDYSLLKIKAKNLPFFKLGSSSDLNILQWVIALGHPGGPYPDYQPAVALGRIRALNKQIPIQLGAKFYDDVIQTDVPIFAGNSGGPLVDMDGKLIGLNGAIMLLNDVAFAVPIDQIKNDLDTLKKGLNVPGTRPKGIFELIKIFMKLQEDIPREDMEKVFKDTPLGKILRVFGGGIPSIDTSRPSLGVRFVTDSNDVIIHDMETNSIAAMAGLQVRDKIIKLNGKDLESVFQLQSAVYESQKGDKIKLTILRRGEKKELVVILSKKAYSKQSCLQRVFADNADNVRDACVKITKNNELMGYGVIISPDGWILTANHILKNYNTFEIVVQNDRRQRYVAQLIGYHGIYDVALLKVKPRQKLKFLSFADDSKLKIGEWVLTVGNEKNVLRGGIVSVLNRSVPPNRKIPTFGLFGLLGKPNKGPLRAYQKVIQHDTYIDSDDFGSPLVNLNGKLEGINVGHFYRGTVFATPISLIKKVLPALKKGTKFVTPYKYHTAPPELDPVSKLFDFFSKSKPYKKSNQPEQGFLGVSIAQDNSGIKITGILKGYAAYNSGLKVNDIVVKLNNKNIKYITTFINKIKSFKPGKKVTVTVLRQRHGKQIQKQFKIILSKRPR